MPGRKKKSIEEEEHDTTEKEEIDCGNESCEGVGGKEVTNRVQHDPEGGVLR